MKTIYKYTVGIRVGQQTLFIPRSAQILSVGHQGNPREIVVWALVNTKEYCAEHIIRVYGTGEILDDLPEQAKLIGTVQMPGGLVWHVFAWSEQI